LRSILDRRGGKRKKREALSPFLERVSSFGQSTQSLTILKEGGGEKEAYKFWIWQPLRLWGGKERKKNREERNYPILNQSPSGSRSKNISVFYFVTADEERREGSRGLRKD